MKQSLGILLSCLLLWIPIGDTTAADATTKVKSSAKKAGPKKGVVVRSKTSASSKARTGKSMTSRIAATVKSSEKVRGGPLSESDLQRDIAAARNVLVRDPKNREAKDRLARVAIATVTMLLASEAVGNVAKADRLGRLLRKELTDVGSRVHRLAADGEAEARQALGYFYAQGFLVARNPEKSCAEYKVAANSHAAAAWQWAQCQIAIEPTAAWRQIENAGGMGHAIAQEWLGRRCLGEFGAETKDFPCARDWLGRSASQGRAKAQTLLAYLFNSGQGGAIDTARALRLYKIAADQGDADAQNNLGEIYETGRGVEKSLPEALQWYERAAERGLGTAQFNAGRLWAIGVSGKSDPARARAWLVQAEAKGIGQARQVLEWLDNESVRAANAVSKDAVSDGSMSRQTR
jgi:TPR repeat protein